MVDITKPISERIFRPSLPEEKAFRISFWVLVILGVLYFLWFIPPNAQGAANSHDLLLTCGDEYITYPYVEHMMQPSQNIHEFWWRLIIYGDYIYGYPFYFFSFLVLLPARLLAGEQFFSQMQINILILRQFISVLPIILAAGFLTYLQTRFRSVWKTLFLFIFLLSIPAVVRQNVQWWHPDALTILFVVLTFFFLDRDELRLGKNFYLAAVMCGLAAATKLMGFFFFLTIPLYIVIAWAKKKTAVSRIAVSAASFVLVMGLAILLSNPFLFYSSQRQKMLEIQAQKQVIMDQGFAHDDPQYYQKGPYFWQWTLEKWYGRRELLIFLGMSLLAACWWGRETRLNLLILAWCLPLSVYLLYFVAPKPDHYWLPIMFPLFSSILGFLPWIENGILMEGRNSRVKLVMQIGLVVLVGALLVYMGLNLTSGVELWIKANLTNQLLGY